MVQRALTQQALWKDERMNEQLHGTAGSNSDGYGREPDQLTVGAEEAIWQSKIQEPLVGRLGDHHPSPTRLFPGNVDQLQAENQRWNHPTIPLLA